ncbi:MAG: VCBS repeat-containing protein, partial [Gemmatimonadetes bacterium]|nr:VCBS repeat-containing protein [Gemmatimonadota bacterium]
WMLVCGDVNGDGHEDVATANSSNNNASILLGDGRGVLGSPQTVASDSFPLATDLGDLDGDGDLDWVTSSFGGDWWLYVNNGSGGFTHTQTFPAPIAASDALLMDIDNDGDLDLGLIDELEDVVIIYKNSGTTLAIPTLSGWSLFAMALLILLAGAVVFRSRRVAAVSQ